MCSTLGEEAWSDGNSYSVVTCMFALHYFYDVEHRLKMFFSNVSNCLKEGVGGGQVLCIRAGLPNIFPPMLAACR